MKLALRFIVAEVVWAIGIFALLLPIALLDNEAPSVAHFIRWLSRSLTLAAFPAGIAIAPAALEAWRGRNKEELLLALVAAASVAVSIFLCIGVAIPLVADQASLSRLFQTMRAVAGSWESRNDAAWNLFTSFFAGLNALLYATIGVQVGIWGRASSFSPALRRAIHWAVGLGLLISGFALWDTTYETLVLHTAADASFAAFYTILIPASVCAGLALPTLALLRGGELPRSI